MRVENTSVLDEEGKEIMTKPFRLSFWEQLWGSFKVVWLMFASRCRYSLAFAKNGAKRPWLFYHSALFYCYLIFFLLLPLAFLLDGLSGVLDHYQQANEIARTIRKWE